MRRVFDWSDLTRRLPEQETDSKGWTVPLSEDEQRILSEIEANLYETDPALARDIADTTVYTVARRNLKWAVLGLVLGLVMLVGGLWISVVVASGGFLVMLLCALAIESNLRKMGKASWDQLMQTMRADGMRDYFGGQRQRMRDRFKRDDQ